ncbi:MAG: PH domain-containing protein [Leptolyngbya sp. SIOISBB]|nr:PH domain-containing protein [Leptolyngbya sp. SIOISBB]
MCFKSAIDGWYYGVIVISAIVLGIAMFEVLKAGSTVGMLIVTVAAVLAVGLPIWLMLTTNYTIRPDVLEVRSGPFRWFIPRSEIHNVQRSRSLLSAPALSLNRLEIKYGQSKSILVSPKDQDAFISTLAVAT